MQEFHDDGDGIGGLKEAGCVPARLRLTAPSRAWNGRTFRSSRGSRTPPHALRTWSVVLLVLCGLGPLSPRSFIWTSAVEDCGCPASCTCRAEGCCTCRRQMLSVRSRCACAGSDLFTDALHGRWEVIPRTAPTISGQIRSWACTQTGSILESWLLISELDHPPRPSGEAV
jgi:hypothetical protein